MILWLTVVADPAIGLLTQFVSVQPGRRRASSDLAGEFLLVGIYLEAPTELFARFCGLKRVCRRCRYDLRRTEETIRPLCKFGASMADTFGPISILLHITDRRQKAVHDALAKKLFPPGESQDENYPTNFFRPRDSAAP